jgi:protein-disulfide isomerase
MKNQTPLLVGTLCLSLLAAALSGAALFKAVTAQASVANAVAASEVALRKVSKVKPWSLSRADFEAALEDSRFMPANPATTSSVLAAKPPKKLDLSDRRYGDPNAQFTLIEFSDFECSYCKTYFEVPKVLVDGSRGNISLVFKHVPIHGEASRKEAFAAECAAHEGGNDAFYKMAASIFDETQSNGNGTKKPLATIASDIGLNGRELTKCIDENLFIEKVKADFTEAIEKYSIKVTPSTVVRHNPTGKEVVITGAVTPNDLLQAMSQLALK